MTKALRPTEHIADIAAHAARMDEPRVSFRLIDPAGSGPAPPPAFLFGGCDADMARAIYGRIATPETGCYAITDAAVAPTGIGLRDGTAFCGAALNLPRAHVAAIAARLNRETLPVRFVPGPLAVLFGPGVEAFATLVTDYLPRLFALQAAGYDIATVKILVPATLPRPLEDLLTGLGLDPEQIARYRHWEEVIQTDLLLLPAVLRQGSRLSPWFGAATRLWTDRVRATVGLPAPTLQQRVYVVEPNRLANHELLEPIASGLGYSVVQPATLDFAARVKLFGEASHIVGVYGPALHGSVFSAAGTRICALRDCHAGSGFDLGGVGAALGHVTGYVFGAADIAEADFRRALHVLDAGDVEPQR